MPGPLSWDINSIRPSLSRLISTLISGSIRSSSQASRELSTASLTAVMMDLCRESNPRKCLFFSKNSLIAICFCFPASGFSLLIRKPPSGPPDTRMARGLFWMEVSGRGSLLILCKDIWMPRRNLPDKGAGHHSQGACQIQLARPRATLVIAINC